jgi:RNA polymerase sigma-70 factor (ECF subfamily)
MPDQVSDSTTLAEFDRYRPLLFSIAYRMLGSVADAEDILQEAFLRWHGAADGEIQSTRAFLVTIVSRLCINHLQSARVRREEYVGQWLPEPIVTGPQSDPLEISRVDESLSIAFMVLLERLSPVERAVFLLREVFEYEYSEIAGMIGKDEANCRQILRRAHQHMAENRPRFKPSPESRQQLLTKFLQATTTGNLDMLVAMLSSDAVLHSDGGGKAPAVPNLVYGADHVARGLLGGMKKFASGANQRRARCRQLPRWTPICRGHYRSHRRSHSNGLHRHQSRKARAPLGPARASLLKPELSRDAAVHGLPCRKENR